MSVTSLTQPTEVSWPCTSAPVPGYEVRRDMMRLILTHAFPPAVEIKYQRRLLSQLGSDIAAKQPSRRRGMGGIRQGRRVEWDQIRGQAVAWRPQKIRRGVLHQHKENWPRFRRTRRRYGQGKAQGQVFTSIRAL
ncbi:hypothetical protein H109_03182 [Trichophyton interdigitale MR816]|uniref:Uncharacterized protein n=1 Tax=Trichophyton interdigitale (strain MR816) TaxID=1215338 RepID=A0A059JBW4_TRIIM|nr:hypothetical protein H109_03182 [Trichophyton interdigitale MR816]